MSEAGRVTRRHRLEHRAVVWALGWLERLPGGLVGGASWLLGSLWFAVDRRRRRMAVANIRGCATHPWSDRPGRVALQSCRNLVCSLLETARGPGRAPVVRVEGRKHLEQARMGGRGILLVSAHLGSWEVVAAEAARDLDLLAVARPLGNPLVDGLAGERRRASGLASIVERREPWRLLAHLRRGGAVGVLLDQSALRKDAVYPRFFGRDAATSRGPALMALRAGAAVLPVFTWRERGGGHVMRYLPPVPRPATGSAARDAEILTARCTAVIESVVSFHPEQWLWMHDRWKRRRG